MADQKKGSRIADAQRESNKKRNIAKRTERFNAGEVQHANNQAALAEAGVPRRQKERTITWVDAKGNTRSRVISFTERPSKTLRRHARRELAAQNAIKAHHVAQAAKNSRTE